MRILIMGLPGSGKTTLAKALAPGLGATHINADAVRAANNDWDFSAEGRLRQARRMQALSYAGGWTISDFVCPTEQTRTEFNADLLIWINTIAAGRFADTNTIFERPACFNYQIVTLDAERHARFISDDLTSNVYRSGLILR